MFANIIDNKYVKRIYFFNFKLKYVCTYIHLYTKTLIFEDLKANHRTQ